MLDKENEIDQLKNENSSLEYKTQTLTKTNTELQKQNEVYLEQILKRLERLEELCTT